MTASMMSAAPAPMRGHSAGLDGCVKASALPAIIKAKPETATTLQMIPYIVAVVTGLVECLFCVVLETGLLKLRCLNTMV